jgi:hypothetical protein
MSIIKGVHVTPQHPNGVKPTMLGYGFSTGKPANPHFREYAEVVPVSLLRAYRYGWRGERVYLPKGTQVYLIAWPDATYRLLSKPQSVHHFDETPTEGVDFSF